MKMLTIHGITAQPYCILYAKRLPVAMSIFMPAYTPGLMVGSAVTSQPNVKND